MEPAGLPPRLHLLIFSSHELLGAVWPGSAPRAPLPEPESERRSPISWLRMPYHKMAPLHLFLARRAPPLGNVWCGSAAGARAGAVREPHQTGIIHPSSPTHENENPTSHNFAAELALPSVHRAAKANMCGLAQAKKPTPTERRPADKAEEQTTCVASRRPMCRRRGE